MAAARELVRNMKAGEALNGMTLTEELKEMYKGREQLLVTCVAVSSHGTFAAIVVVRGCTGRD